MSWIGVALHVVFVEKRIGAGCRGWEIGTFRYHFTHEVDNPPDILLTDPLTDPSVVLVWLLTDPLVSPSVRYGDERPIRVSVRRRYEDNAYCCGR